MKDIKCPLCGERMIIVNMEEVVAEANKLLEFGRRSEVFRTEIKREVKMVCGEDYSEFKFMLSNDNIFVAYSAEDKGVIARNYQYYGSIEECKNRDEAEFRVMAEKGLI